MVEPCIRKQDFLLAFYISVYFFGATNLEFFPLNHLLQSYLPLDEVLFAFEFFYLVSFIGFDVITIEQLDVSDFVNFCRELDILLDVVDPYMVFFVLKLFHQFLSHFVSFLPIDLFIFLKPLVIRQCYYLLDSSFFLIA